MDNCPNSDRRQASAGRGAEGDQVDPKDDWHAVCAADRTAPNVVLSRLGVGQQGRRGIVRRLWYVRCFGVIQLTFPSGDNNGWITDLPPRVVGRHAAAGSDIA